MCYYCDDPGYILTPSVADVPEMDVEAVVEVGVSERGSVGTLAVYRADATDKEAVFKIRYCPMCGRRLAGGE